MVTFPIYPHMSRVKPPIYSLYVHGYPLTPIHIMWAIRYPITPIPMVGLWQGASGADDYNDYNEYK